MKRTIVILSTFFTALMINAQNVENILKSVEQNNKELQALQKGTDAAVSEIKSKNNLDDPSIEYSPFFRKGTEGVISSELVVSQGFDFPTLYAARHKSEKLHQEALDLQYLLFRRDVLLKAKKLCLDLIYLNQIHTLFDKRYNNAKKLLIIFTKRLENGDATVLEVNKVKMDLMNIQKEVAELDAERQTAIQSLIALNGNIPITCNTNTYEQEYAINDDTTTFNRIMASDFDIRTTRASEQALAQDVKVSKQNWIPKLEIGYRRNTEMEETSHGFLVGASFPLFSSRNKIKIAKAKYASAQLQAENTRIETENNVRAKIHELQKLEKAKEAYDVDLLYQTLDLLYKLVENGEISVINYYIEAEEVYKNLQTYMEVIRQYQNTMAEIYKNDL